MNRSWMVRHSFDDLLAGLLLWGALGLPWAACCSVDAGVGPHFALWGVRRPHHSGHNDHGLNPSGPQKTECSLAGFALWANVSTVYFLAAWSKTDTTWVDGSALLIAITTPHLGRPLSFALCARYPTLLAILHALGRVVVPLEFATPLILALPLQSMTPGLQWVGIVGRRCRAVLTVSLIAMHASIGMLLRLDVGPINVAGLVAFLPPSAWSMLGASDTPRPATGVDSAKHDGGQKMRMQGHLVSCLASVRSVLCVGAIVLQIHNILSQVQPRVMESPGLTGAVGLLNEAGSLLHLGQKYNVFAPRPPSEGWWMAFPGRLRGGLEVDVLETTRGQRSAPQFRAVPRHLARNSGGACDATDGTCAALESAEGMMPVLDYDGRPLDPRTGPPPDFELYNHRFCKFFEVLVQGWNDFEPGSEMWETRKQRQERLRLLLGQWICRQWNSVHGGTDHELLSFDMMVYLQRQTRPVCAHNTAIHGAEQVLRGGKVYSDPVEEINVWDHQC